MNSPRESVLLAALLLINVSGCADQGVELVEIEGTVMLDNKPLHDAQVVFRPESGRPSIGITDFDGHYVLRYTEEDAGALPGTHKVSISTYLEPDTDTDDPVRSEGFPEKVPAVYNTKTTLSQDVSPDHSEPVNFDLKSDDRTAQN